MASLVNHELNESAANVLEDFRPTTRLKHRLLSSLDKRTLHSAMCAGERRISQCDDGSFNKIVKYMSGTYTG